MDEFGSFFEGGGGGLEEGVGGAGGGAGGGGSGFHGEGGDFGDGGVEPGLGEAVGEVLLGIGEGAAEGEAGPEEAGVVGGEGAGIAGEGGEAVGGEEDGLFRAGEVAEGAGDDAEEEGAAEGVGGGEGEVAFEAEETGGVGAQLADEPIGGAAALEFAFGLFDLHAEEGGVLGFFGDDVEEGEGLENAVLDLEIAVGAEGLGLAPVAAEGGLGGGGAGAALDPIFGEPAGQAGAAEAGDEVEVGGGKEAEGAFGGEGGVLEAAFEVVEGGAVESEGGAEAVDEEGVGEVEEADLAGSGFEGSGAGEEVGLEDEGEAVAGEGREALGGGADEVEAVDGDGAQFGAVGEPVLEPAWGGGGRREIAGGWGREGSGRGEIEAHLGDLDVADLPDAVPEGAGVDFGAEVGEGAGAEGGAVGALGGEGGGVDGGVLPAEAIEAAVGAEGLVEGALELADEGAGAEVVGNAPAEGDEGGEGEGGSGADEPGQGSGEAAGGGAPGAAGVWRGRRCRGVVHGVALNCQQVGRGARSVRGGRRRSWTAFFRGILKGCGFGWGMNSPLRLLAFCLAWCAVLGPLRVRAGEAWEEAGRGLFDSYAEAMQGKNYSVFIANCESKSRSLFREFTLWQMDLMTEDDLMGVLPRDDAGRAISLQALLELDDEHFWVLYTDWMRKRELALADKARRQQGFSGLPVYKLKVLTKYQDTLYMVAERSYAKPSAVPIPLTVLEAVQEKGVWKLKIPREIIWEAMEAGRARSLAIEQELKSQPYDVRAPLKPPGDGPLPAASGK